MKVGSQKKEGRLILVWNDGDRRTIGVGVNDSTIGWAVAWMKKAEIEQDWVTDHYDLTLLKYKSRKIDKFATEISVSELGNCS